MAKHSFFMIKHLLFEECHMIVKGWCGWFRGRSLFSHGGWQNIRGGRHDFQGPTPFIHSCIIIVSIWVLYVSDHVLIFTIMLWLFKQNGFLFAHVTFYSCDEWQNNRAAPMIICAAPHTLWHMNCRILRSYSTIFIHTQHDYITTAIYTR